MQRNRYKPSRIPSLPSSNPRWRCAARGRTRRPCAARCAGSRSCWTSSRRSAASAPAGRNVGKERTGGRHVPRRARRAGRHCAGDHRRYQRDGDLSASASRSSGASSARSPPTAGYSSNSSSIRRSARRTAFGSAPERRSASAASSSTATGSATVCSGSAASRCTPLHSTALDAPSTNLSARDCVIGAPSSASALELEAWERARGGHARRPH